MRAIVATGVLVLVVIEVRLARAEDLVSDVGVALTVGGGVEGFTNESVRDTTGPAGTWEVRGTIGTRLPVSSELAYFGSASTVHAVHGSMSGALVSTGFEIAVRTNVSTGTALRPYVYTGTAWRHYEVIQAHFTMSATGLNDSDDVIEIPLGAGSMYHHPSGFVVDLRGVFRAAGRATLVAVPTEYSGFRRYAPMHTWSIGAHLGYEF